MMTSNMLATIFILCLTLSPILSSAPGPVVTLPNGKIRGRVATTFGNKTFYAFQKVPYASPPVGALRFKAPQPAQDWGGVLDATTLDVICHQTAVDPEIASEDCLYINIYTPQLPDQASRGLPVMFFIHGGGFTDGSSLDYPPDRFVDEDVILVTTLYRLGIFGFTSTQDEVIPGNSGLKDQQLAINWTHQNIQLFGGDPDKITIFGQGTGAVSVGYQLLNQRNRGLFSAAILQSGSVLSPFGYQRNSREIAFKTAAFLDPRFESNRDSQVLLEFLLDVDAADLVGAAQEYHAEEYGLTDIELFHGFFWAPVVEVKNPDAVLTKKMFGLVRAGNIVPVPIVVGITSEEDIVFQNDTVRIKNTLGAFDEFLGLLVPHDMEVTDPDQLTTIGSAIRDIYTGGEPLAEHLGDGVRYASDTAFTRSVIKFAEFVSEHTETYFYQFSYSGKLPNNTIRYDGAETVGDGEDLAYLFCSGQACDISDYPEGDQITQKRLIQLWTDFAKYKKPIPRSSELLQNVTWPYVDTEGGEFIYLDIDEHLELRNHPKNLTYDAWNMLYDSLGRDDFDTY